MLHEDMCERYRDILSMTIPDWVLDPFTCLAEVEVAYQEELIEMQANEELKPKMKGGYTSFWLQQEIRQLVTEPVSDPRKGVRVRDEAVVHELALLARGAQWSSSGAVRRTAYERHSPLEQAPAASCTRSNCRSAGATRRAVKDGGVGRVAVLPEEGQQRQEVTTAVGRWKNMPANW
ncbi:hypothetical protein TTRE_0000956901 [Trichuris trichiura]|uniref:Uncharacterized protein n=1 Tax=Trichuris trichiura TaxID=36087 RepID=A0A077ZLD7_TRITR|nr:hypothetical protein TTRE_0000956901 [Trichuris trichiura]